MNQPSRALESKQIPPSTLKSLVFTLLFWQNTSCLPSLPSQLCFPQGIAHSTAALGLKAVFWLLAHQPRLLRESAGPGRAARSRGRGREGEPQPVEEGRLSRDACRCLWGGGGFSCWSQGEFLQVASETAEKPRGG